MRKNWYGWIDPTVRSSSPYFESLKWKPPRRPTMARRLTTCSMLVLGRWCPRSTRHLACSPACSREQQRRPPVGVDARVERGLVRLVLGVQLPVGRERRRGARAGLRRRARTGRRKSAWPGWLVPSASQTVSAVEPSSHAEVDDGTVVLERALAHVGIGVGERPELVRHRTVTRGRRVVLEGVRVHRVEGDAELVGVARGARRGRRDRPTARGGSRCGSRR